MKKLKGLFLFGLATLSVACSNDNDSSANAFSCESDIPFVQTGRSFDLELFQLGAVVQLYTISVGECDGQGFDVQRLTRNAAGVAVGTVQSKIRINNGYVEGFSPQTGITQRIFKKNAAVGDVWEDIGISGGTIRQQIIDLDSIITVPAGTFSCVVTKYDDESQLGTSYMFYNAQVGQVLQDAGFYELRLTDHN